VKLLLDTCTVLWTARGDAAIPDRVRKLIAAADDVRVSAATAWEIAIKHTRGRLPLPAPIHVFLTALRARHGFVSVPIDEESALHVAKLPVLHADPFDRILVSQAIVHGLTIVTPDPLITQYPARTLW
jgi:PIN domain nuclease of toxin-antitoxin system